MRALRQHEGHRKEVWADVLPPLLQGGRCRSRIQEVHVMIMDYRFTVSLFGVDIMHVSAKTLSLDLYFHHLQDPKILDRYEKRILVLYPGVKIEPLNINLRNGHPRGKTYRFGIADPEGSRLSLNLYFYHWGRRPVTYVSAWARDQVTSQEMLKEFIDVTCTKEDHDLPESFTRFYKNLEEDGVYELLRTITPLAEVGVRWVM